MIQNSARSFVQWRQCDIQIVRSYLMSNYESAVICSCHCRFGHMYLLAVVDMDFVSFLIERIFGGQLFISCGQFTVRAVIDVQVETDGVDLTK